MIKIEQISNDAKVTDTNGNTVFKNQLLTLHDFNNVVVKEGEIMYSVDELHIKHKAAKGFEGQLGKEAQLSAKKCIDMVKENWPDESPDTPEAASDSNDVDLSNSIIDAEIELDEDLESTGEITLTPDSEPLLKEAAVVEAPTKPMPVKVVPKATTTERVSAKTPAKSNTAKADV
jgi:hypothetical protein